jgi:hypothetical protein
MKKNLLTLIFLISFLFSKAQILISTDFDSYVGTIATIPSGFYISWNNSTSYYSSTAYCGLACNSYKFGVDSSTIITPSFSFADSVRFMMRGTGTWHPNKFKVFGSTDSSNWILIHSYDSIPLAKLNYTLPVNSSYTNLMFYYEKDSSGLNVAFDDLYIFQGTLSIGIQEISKSGVSIYPNPSNGPLNIQVSNMTLNNVTVSVTNILGRIINSYPYAKLSGQNTFDLSGLDQGIYMIHVKSDKTEIIRRVLFIK